MKKMQSDAMPNAQAAKEEVALGILSNLKDTEKLQTSEAKTRFTHIQQLKLQKQLQQKNMIVVF